MATTAVQTVGASRSVRRADTQVLVCVRPVSKPL